MKEYNKKFISKCDGLKLDVYITEPENVKGVFEIVHGMAESKERYYDFMRFLTNLGYVCVIHDIRGHGNSVHSHDDWGYFFDSTGSYVLEDAHDIGMYYKNKYKVPLYLFGHSMGSLIVRGVIKKYDKDYDKLIVCGSPSANPSTKFAIILVKTMIRMKGERYRSPFIQNLALGAYNKRFNENVPNTWLSVNRENVEKYNADPKCGFTFTLNGFLNLFKLMDFVYDAKGWQKKNLDLPILFLAGEFDPCIESIEKWNEAQGFLKQIGYKNIDHIMYPNMRHEILQETNHQDVYEDIIEFIKK